jgi:parallel beta-helix repeat protein
MKRRSQYKQYALGTIVILCMAAISVYALLGSHAATPYASSETEVGTLTASATQQADPTASGGKAVIFGQANTTSAGLGTPLVCPAGSVPVSPSSIPSFQSNTNYCFAAGTYSDFSRTFPSGDGWYGQGSAILDGGNSQQTAFSNGAAVTNAVVNGFTIKDYTYNCATVSPPYECGGSYSASLRFGSNITISDNTFGPDWQGGYFGTGGLSLGGGGYTGGPGGTPGQYDSTNSWNAGPNDSTVTHNLFTGLGWGSVSISSAQNDIVSYNEVTNTDEMNMDTEGDIAALGKFALVENLQILGNYVHNNPDTGIWCDVFCVNTTVEGNTVSNNQVGFFYEISCNALIANNTFINNGDSDAGTGNNGAAIRISSSGSSTFSGVSACRDFNNDGKMPGPQNITISGNTMTGNHEGVALFDGHVENGNEPVSASNPYIQDNNIIVTGNSITTETTSAGTDTDAWAASVANPGTAQSYSNNKYTIFSSHQNAFNAGNSSWSSWKSSGYDTTGTCILGTGGSC